MALEDELKAQAMALVSQQMANWVVEIQRSITNHQAALVRALDEMQENVARYDEKIDEGAIAGAIAKVLADNPVAPPPPPPPVAAPPSGPSGPAPIEMVHSMIEVDMGSNLTEVLTNLVNEAARRSDRVAMFIVKGANAVGWYARGFDSNEAVKQIQIGLGADTVFASVSTARQTQVFDLAGSPGTAQALARLGRPGAHGMAVPMVLREKLAAILYCDSSGVFDDARVAFIDALVRFAAKTTDLLSFAPKTPGFRPTPAPPQTGSGGPAMPPSPFDEPEGGATMMFAPAKAPAPAAAPAPPPPEGGGTVMFSPAQAAALKGSIPAPTPPPAKAPEGAGTVMFTPSQMEQMRQQMAQMKPAAPAAPAAPALSPEEQKLHDDAKRFARLIVSEIKLYNEAKVTEGRKSRDIYDRLKEDIERGRQMYHERINPSLKSTTNYFQDELVRLLAGGDAGALGPM